MSYQVLARKWRPRGFEQMVGQEHVVRALSNALDHDRVHHAFLFTGTRGVGKTSVARIFAKSLNCEQGVSSRPCGDCDACRDIDAGRFVDLIEVDAASRTGVDDTRDLLDNVQYAPAQGRFKVYLIDEVHMFSKSSFNALLKTLEEPPPHVKFLLATTDPQKLPVTILSRCLQFNLRSLSPALITEHLDVIVKREGIECESGALGQIARAADGSIRDALSLLDQAISFGGGRLAATEVADMLGSIDQQHVMSLMAALSARDGRALLDTVAELSALSADYEQVLADLVTLLQRVALVQVAPEAVDDFVADPSDLRRLADSLSPEDVQLFYQIGLIGRRDLPLSPERRGGFEMILLRMLAFMPDDGPGASESVTGPGSVSAAARSGSADRPVATAATPPAATPVAANEPREAGSAAETTPGRRRSGRHGMAKQALANALGAEEVDPSEHRTLAPAPVRSRADAPRPTAAVVPLPTRSEPRVDRIAETPPPDQAPLPVDAEVILPTPGPDGLGDEDWDTLFQALPFKGVSRELASHCVLAACDGERVRLLVASEQAHLLSERTEKGVRQVFEAFLDHPFRLDFEPDNLGERTPAARRAAREAERQRQAEINIEHDPMVQELKQRFGATIRDGSIKPLD
jgi:DNA polymerase-3 subunit gamma/tau